MGPSCSFVHWSTRLFTSVTERKWTKFRRVVASDLRIKPYFEIFLLHLVISATVFLLLVLEGSIPAYVSLLFV